MCFASSPPPLSALTTFRLGGPPLDFATASTPAEAAAAIRRWNAASLPWHALGGGSNILASDAPLPFAVLRAVAPPGPLDPAPVGPDLYAFPAGVPLGAVARWAVETRGSLDWAFASGIPGTLGGAIAGNAGAFGSAVGDLVHAATLVLPDASIKEIPASALRFAYRSSALQTTHAFLAAAVLRVPPGDPAAALARRAEILALRRDKHPDPAVTPTAGSFFKNLPPPPGSTRRTPAGALLEAAGAKHVSMGHARVFPKHANILVADPGATAAEVAELAALLARRVLEKFAVRLTPEVRYWGNLPPPG